MRAGRTRIRRAAVALALVAASVAAGCGEKSEDTSPKEPRTFDLALDWFPNPDHVGIYQALENGYFEEAGLEVEPQVPSDPSAPIKQVAAGRVDLAISYEPEVLLAREQGLDVVAVGALASRPLTSLVWLDEEIKRVEDLEGKRVATAGIPYQAAYLEAILTDAGLEPDDVDRVDVGLNLLPPLLAGRVDAVLGMFWNVEGVELRERGEKPTVKPVDELGIPTYNELVLVANSEQVEGDAESIRLFLDALEQGTRDAQRDPKGATDVVLEANDDLDPKLTRAQVQATLEALQPTGDEAYGYMFPDQWRSFARFFADRGLIEAMPAVDELLNNELVPGEIPD